MSAPSPIDVERRLLGAMLLSGDVVNVAAVDERVTADDFASPAHQRIFAAILDQHAEGGADRPLVRARLDGDEDAIAALDATVHVPAAALARQYAAQVREAGITRRVRAAAAETIKLIDQRALHGAELARHAERAISDAGQVAEAASRPELADVLVMEEIDRAHNATTTSTPAGIPSGFDEFDDRTGGGFFLGQVIVIAGRPSMGKSTIMLNLAEYQAMQGRGVLLCSLEMNKAEIARRLVASGSKVPLEDLKRGRLRRPHLERMLRAGARLEGRPLLIDDTRDLSISDLRVKAERVARRHPLQFVFLDYLQLARTEGRAENRTQAVGAMSRALKVLAGDLGVVVVVGSQLSRDVDRRSTVASGKRPVLTDLRDSGEIEQDADVVSFMFREEFYDTLAGDEPKRPGEAEWILAKIRDGKPGDVALTARLDQSRFEPRVQPRVHADQRTEGGQRG